MAESICPHCGTALFGLVRSCYKCGGAVEAREDAEKRMEQSSAEAAKSRSTFSKLLGFQKILVINWAIVPLLIVIIWLKSGFFTSVVFLILWLILDKIWDTFSDFLIASAGWVSDADPLFIQIVGAVPSGMAAAMIIDVLVTLLLPTFVAGAFLLF